MANKLEFDAVVSVDQLNKLLGDLRSGAEGAAKAVNDALGGTVTKKLVLETATDASGAKQLVAVEKERLSVADRVTSAYKQLDKVQSGSLTSLRQQVNEAKQARDSIARYSESVTQTGARIRQTNGEWAVANQRLAGLSRQLDIAGASTFWDRVKVGLRAEGLISFSNGLVQITQGLQAASILIGGFISQINNLVTAVAKLESFELSFVAAGAGSAGGAQALQEASRIALGLGSNLGVVRDGFQRLTPVVLNSGGSINNVSQITEALSSRFAAFGLSADASRRVMNGVIQAFAKGKLQAEELTQQISEADPAFKTDFAGALGVTVQQLEAMVKAGEVTTEVLLRALPALGKSALLYGKLGNSATDAVGALDKSNQSIDGIGVTTEQVRTQLDSLSQLNFERFATAFQPVIQAFLRAQAVVIDFITYITELEGIRGLGNVFAAFAQSVINLLEVLAKIAGIVATALSPLLELAGAIANNAVGIGILTALIGAKLLVSLKAVPAALTAGFGAFQVLSASITQAIVKYTGLGAAATTAAGKVAAAQTAIGAAGAGGAGAKQFSLFGNAGDIAGTVGNVQQLELNLGNLNQKATELFPTFSKAFTGIKGAVSSTISAFANLGTSAPSAFKALQASSGAALGSLKTSGLAAANAMTTAFVSAAGSIKAVLATSLTGITAVLGPLAAAFIVVGAAQQGVDAIFSGAKKINEDLAASLKDINAELQKQGQEVQKSGDGWSSSVQNVGTASAVYDRLARAFNAISPLIKAATYEEAKYSQATIAAANSSIQFGNGLDKLVAKYDAERKASDGSAQAKQREKQSREAIAQIISTRIATLESEVSKEKQLVSSSSQVDQSKKLLIATYQSEIESLKQIASARGFDIQKQQDQAAIAKQLSGEIKIIIDSEIEQIRRRQQEVSRAYDAEIQKLDEKKKKLQESRDAETEATNERIRQLRQLGPAEQELENARIRNLQARAAAGDLEAKAELERLQRNKAIAQIQEDERAKAAAAKAQEKAIDDEIASKRKASSAEQSQANEKIVELQGQLKNATSEAASAAGEFTGRLKEGETAADAIKKRMEEIRDIAATIKIPSVNNARFAGGSVTAGGRYTVNEFGREMFLSSSGRLSEIKARPWSSWTAPSSGTVIPAHIAAGLRVPSDGIQLSRSNANLVDRNMTNSRSASNQNFAKLIQAIRSTQIGKNDELATVQAHQALQIGRLGRAVDDLVSKDWNVNVKVKNVGNGAFLEALNHRM